jgi:penicillin-binding protein 1A
MMKRKGNVIERPGPAKAPGLRPLRGDWRGKVRRYVPLLVAFVGSLFLFMVICTMIIVWSKFHTLIPDYLPDLSKKIDVYDRFGHKVTSLYGERDQQPVALSEISKHLKNAVITAEDRDFYIHDGVNLLSITRAAIANVSAGRIVQGGSTISQQVIKNLYFSGQQRGFDEKFQEALMAMDMEQRYPKDKILEAYLNCVYFGGGVYGAERAAEHYFGKKPDKLTVAESAFLAGLITAPSELSLVKNRPRALAHQKQIISDMVSLKYLTPDEGKAAKQAKLVFRASENSSQKYNFYLSEVVAQLRSKFGDDVYGQKLRVYTAMDPAAQELAQKTLASGIRTAPKGINQGALVSVSIEDGGIIAMVGGAGSYNHNQWNRAVNPHTAGSSFKPFVYLAGLHEGVLTPDSILLDAPLSIEMPGAPTYSPSNFDGQYLGEMTIRKALALSRNTCAVRVAQEVGPQHIVDLAQDAGITSKLEPNLSLALGSSAVSPLDMAVAYATIARGGEYVQPFLIRRIEDSHGRLIEQVEPRREKVFATEPCAQLVDAMQDVIERGTGVRARLFDRPVAGKTGTSDDSKDIWFVGFTPDTSTAIWGGNDQNKAVPGTHVTGGTIMASIFKNYMQGYYRKHPVPAGKFIAPREPLMEEPEPIHIMPAPATIFDRLFGGGPVIQEYHWNSDRPKVTPDDDDSPAKEDKPKKKRKGLLKKLLRWIDDF